MGFCISSLCEDAPQWSSRMKAHAPITVITYWITVPGRSFPVGYTHRTELCLIAGLEGPLDCGNGMHLAPHLAGDTAQLEAFISHSLLAGVHLHTGTMAERHYSTRREDEQHTVSNALFLPFTLFLVWYGARAWVGGWPVAWEKGWYKGKALVFSNISISAGKTLDSTWQNKKTCLLPALMTCLLFSIRA